MSNIPKAALYYSPISVWSAVTRLALEEKGYGDDEIDLRVVDIEKGENYDPTFLRLNATASVPALVVPYENSLTEDVASHRYKSLADVKVAFINLERLLLETNGIYRPLSPSSTSHARRARTRTPHRARLRRR
jgi:hypothetical protein